MRLLALLLALLSLNCAENLTAPPVTPPEMVQHLAPSALTSLNVALVDTDDEIRCSGSWIGERRVLTAAHCVTGNNLLFHIREAPGEPALDAVVEKTDFVTDLATLLVVQPPKAHMVAPIGADPLVGTPLESVNNAYQMEDSYMRGYVGGYQKDPNPDGLEHNPDQLWMQVMMPATFGSSGGGVFNAKGELVGVFSWKFRNWDGVIYMVRAQDIQQFLATK